MANHKTLVIVPTTDCQLRCSFCLCLESLGKGEGSSVEDMIKFLFWQIELNTEDSFTIEVFGGEPTIAYLKIKEVYSFIMDRYRNRKISWTLFTNGVFPKAVDRDFDFFINVWDEIIISIEGPWDLAQDRHPSLITHTKAVDNFKKCLPYMNTGIAFVVFPETDLNRVFNYFADMGCRYFNFEIVTHINNDKSSGVGLKDLYKTFDFIYKNILLWNVENPSTYRLFTVPRELISAENYFRRFPAKGCVDAVRALAPSGNIYFCRDMAINEPKLIEQSKPNLIFSSNQVRSYNIKDFELDIESNSFKEQVKQYEMWNSCPLKSMEHYHFIGGKQEWIHNKDFQDLLIRPLFELQWEMSNMFFTEELNEVSFKKYCEGVELYGKLLEIFRGTYGS